ncbi:FRG1-like family-domain-containing protein [Aspergillus ambiguus]|uniref:uncharacterized protein n=1 Tax=Aspergillus ambiguus TaxID=176160 RepID=UPI003CCCF448
MPGTSSLLVSSVDAMYALVYAGLVFLVTLLVYRWALHPLAHIPGPPLAKVTYLYEWYYDLYLSGQFTFQLKDLHRKYGPVIRINPDEFHDLHRLRRSALDPFFSKKSVADLTPVMRRPIDVLRRRLREASLSAEPVNMVYIYATVTPDIIDDHCFARDPVHVLQPDWGRKGFDDVDSFLEVSLLNIHIPWFMRLSSSLPDRIVKMLAPAMAGILDFRREKDLSRQVAIRHERDRSHEHAGHRTVFHELLESKLPPRELQPARLRDEAFSLVTAGTTVGMTALLTHQNAAIYPDPRAFRPERWLREGDQMERPLERYLVPFYHGSRACLGVNLARAELVLILAAVFHEFDFDVRGVRHERDVDVCRDYILGTSGDKPKKRKHRAVDPSDSRPVKASKPADSTPTDQDDNPEDQSWVSADTPSDLAGPVILVLSSEPPCCIASDANGKVFASTVENLVDGDPATAEPHDVRQVWVATRVAGTEAVSFKGHHGKYLSCDSHGIPHATAAAISHHESFLIIPGEIPGTFALQTSGGAGATDTFLCARETPSAKAASGKTVDIRGDATAVSFETTVRVRMQARFKPRIKASKETKAREKISRLELEEIVGRRLEEEVRRLRRARREGDFHEVVLDVRVKGKHDKFA